MYKKTLNIIKAIALIAYLLVVFSFVTKQQAKVKFDKMVISIPDSEDLNFINTEDIEKYILNKYNFHGQGFYAINTDSIEGLLKSYPYIKSAEAYKNNKGSVAVSVTQRKPVLRIIDKNNKSYYLDNEGMALPLSAEHKAYVVLATGNITPEYAAGKLAKLGSFIENNAFWKAQLQQIYVDKNLELTLIPSVGEQVIYLGAIEGYEEKLENCYWLYKKAFIKTGWNRYKSINLKYKNQIVCKKR